jgi:rhodanese-related sulfurtransferase
MTFEGEIASLDKSKTYAIYCQSGRRSRIAVETMNEAGFTKLFNLDEGIGSWQAAGLPVVA